MINNRTKSTIEKQSGFVSIVITALIMVILSLITIGFTRIMQREQREVLDRQLSRQAIYAAESGINDIYNALKTDPALPVEKNTCDVSGAPAVNGGVIDANGGVAYTCALYDKTPSELVYSLGASDSKIVELQTESGNPFSLLFFSWGNEQGNNDISSLPACGVSASVFPNSRSGQTPLLKIDLTDTRVLSRDQLINRTDYLYVSPCRGSLSQPTSHTFLSSSKGTIVQVPCDANQALPCSFVLNGVNASSSYLMRISSVYDSAKVMITAEEQDGASFATVQFSKAQMSIDVTAKASDIVRRLRVTLPVTETKELPEGVFQSFDGVCKLLGVDTASVPPVINSDPRCNY